MGKRHDDEWLPSGGRRQALIPSHSSSLTSRLGIAVLERYAKAKKARYQGQFLEKPTAVQLRDSGNWEVLAKTGDSHRGWIELTDTYQSKNSGRRIRKIHLGHKLSAAEFYDKGPKSYIERRIKNLPADEKTKKERELWVRFKNRKEAGKKMRFEQRRIINEARNIRFEHYSYNTSHGGDGHNYMK
ncbi:hypothetical protein [Pseudoalteromonas sp. OOF1S-7]|uniref:hypothetical protein n=1 Tax=Pseudoalteromonas sp. OOF1S-7 TaxID=2917757 RepID=UPI001EF61D85|nr:hypothetical protein [Pseudoalteromonas sp. OOF1S-7]MCG7537069.1 hypothetical protein [Pseudoalteromonas sp. OOF1S-7]